MYFLQRRRASLCLAVLLTVLCFSLSSAVAENRLIIGSTGEATSLDPRFAPDAFSFKRLWTVFESLGKLSPSLQLEPSLATGWDIAEDGLSIRFDLREGVQFHHGRPFSADDVRYTFEWILDESNEARDRARLSAITAIETPDDYTVIFFLDEVNSFVLERIAVTGIVPADLAEEADFGDNPVGTGPFVFESWQRDDRFVARAFEDYWDGRAQLDVVEIRPIPEDGTRLLALEAGEIHMYQSNVTSSEVPRLEEDPNFVVSRTPGIGYEYLGMNNANPPLDNVLVRQAIAHLIPREAIVAQILDSIGTPGVSMVSPSLPWFNPDVIRFDYDPERARELLAEAGFEAGDISLRLYTDERSFHAQVAEILQAELAQVGIEMSINIEEFGAVLDRFSLTDDYDLMLFRWSGQTNPHDAMFRQFTSDGSWSQLVNYSNPRVDALLAQGPTVAPDSEASYEIYAEAQAIIVEEAPYAYIHYAEEIAVHRANVEGWQAHPSPGATYSYLHRVQLR